MTVFGPVVTLAVIAALWSGALPDGMEMDSTCIGKHFIPLFEKILMPNHFKNHDFHDFAECQSDGQPDTLLCINREAAGF